MSDDEIGQVKVKVKQAVFEGALEEVTTGRALVSFDGRMPPTFALGSQVEAVFSGGVFPRSLKAKATVIQRMERDGGRNYMLDYVLDHATPSKTRTQRGERRRHLRVTAPPGTRSPIQLVPVARSGRERIDLAQGGRLLDISGGGLGVLLDATEEGPLTGHDRVRVSFSPPGAAEVVTRPCRIRSRWITHLGIRLGLQLEAPDDDQLTFEPQWTCTHCSEPSMLEASHPHCLGCGRPRATDAEIVDWGDLIPRGQHRFTGSEQTCTACAATWSSAARYCGECGAGLQD